VTHHSGLYSTNGHYNASIYLLQDVKHSRIRLIYYDLTTSQCKSISL